MILSFKGKRPKISDNAFVADNASIIGDVVIEEGASIWFGAVLRGDYGPIRIGRNSSIQDNSVVHGDPEMETVVGENVTVGHSAILHGCNIRDNVLVGMGSAILNHAVVGEYSVIGAKALVTQDKVVAAKSMVLGVPAKTVREVTDEEISIIKRAAAEYIGLAKEYLSQRR